MIAGTAIRAKALSMGFLGCGFAEAGFLAEEAPRLESWLKAGKHGTMAWMERHFDLRLNPTILVPGARTVISVLFNYYPQHTPAAGTPKLARYAYGEDYHRVVKDRLHELLAWIRSQYGAVEGRVFVDSAPVMERAWAARAGLGWIGKNSLLLSKGAGSYFFLGELVVDLAIAPDAPVADHCGRCTACLDACPTEAIVQPFVIDSNRCISYLTIEFREALDPAFQPHMNNWAFGCDICQEVCPWNRFSAPHQEPRLEPGPWKDMEARDWEHLNEQTFKQLFGQSAVTRTGWKGLRRNLDFLQGEAVD
jgi:epoxyqueuosine reductase